jgi:predicted nicotinamide N-methyase
MSNGSRCGQPRFPAELVEVDVATATDPQTLERGPTLELYTVAGLEDLVDGQALLRARDPEEPPYWALVWIGARAIAARMLEDPPAAGRRVLDIGCGLGLSGLAAAGAGAHVTFADIAAEALEFVRMSAAHHQLDAGAYETLTLDFSCDRPREAFDVVLAADVVYDPSTYEALADFLDAALLPDGTLWLTETLRADARRVLDLLGARGFRCQTEAVWVRENERPERTWLHRLRR